MTTQTQLMEQALKRDLDRYIDQVGEDDDAGAHRTMGRMIDTVMELRGCDRPSAVAAISDLLTREEHP